MVQKGEHALCAKVHNTCHSPTRTRVLLHAAENSTVLLRLVVGRRITEQSPVGLLQATRVEGKLRICAYCTQTEPLLSVLSSTSWAKQPVVAPGQQPLTLAAILKGKKGKGVSTRKRTIARVCSEKCISMSPTEYYPKHLAR
jgi:hypothetical protein